MPIDLPGGAKGKPKPGGGKGFRIAGYNGWVVVGGLVAAIAVGLYLRSKLASSSASSPTSSAAPTDPNAGAGGGASGSASDLTPYEDLASALNGLTGILGAGGGNFVSPDTIASVAPAQTAPTFASSSELVAASGPAAPTSINIPSAVGGSGSVQKINPSAPLTWSNLATPGEAGALQVGSGILGGASAGAGIELPGIVGGSGPQVVPSPPHTAATLVTPNPTITANKTGGSANKKQGTYAVH